MQRNPDLDVGHRCLSLKNTTGVDHINPKSWQGNVKVGGIDLKAVWKTGQLEAEKLFKSFYGSKINFDDWFSKDGRDLLRPNGDYVGVSYSPNDARSEEENHEPLHPEFTNYQNEASAQNADTEADGDTYDDELGMGLEDLLPDSPEGIDADAEPLAFSKKISHEGKEILKNSLVATLNNKSSKKVPWRTWRVRGVAIEDLYNSKQEEMDPDDMEDDEYMKKGDLAASLVQCGGKICLCVLEVTAFQFVAEKITQTTAALNDLEDKNK